MLKRNLALLLLLLLAPTVGATAQDWKEWLKNAATEVADKLTDGLLNRNGIVGTWNYTAPGVRFESDDWLNRLGSGALEAAVAGKLEKAYALVGIEPGVCCFAFDNEEGMTITAGTRTIDGYYEFDAETETLTFRFAQGGCELYTLKSHAYLDGKKLQVVFPVTELVGMAATIGEHFESLSAIADLLDNYDKVYAGFEFERVQ